MTSDFFESLDKIIKMIDSLSYVKELKILKVKILNDSDLKTKIKMYQKEESLALKKEILNNKDYKKYREAYQKLSFLIYKINHELEVLIK